ncbi:hypothetical protein [Halarcobacter ebronensis]|uniref:Uncharacterized protein n=1 Tax=Halarcobacter ebronensis TaxID=1462615 RepID=A0A4Q1AQA2_9BACT|nr:hypothetical protein [Halarcobacter ebronensis]QKF80729.1 putative membrane protein [Halarcobacter ebronensis]RXK08522.1 hypothetical protein CRV07_01610 [Halarcobacter ebronensis]
MNIGKYLIKKFKLKTITIAGFLFILMGGAMQWHFPYFYDNYYRPFAEFIGYPIYLILDIFEIKDSLAIAIIGSIGMGFIFWLILNIIAYLLEILSVRKGLMKKEDIGK